MRNIVAIANIGETNLLEIAETFLQGQIIRQRLAGMLKITECIDHRYAGVFSHSFNRAVRKSSQHDGVDPAFEIVRDIAELFASIQTPLRLVHERDRAAQACHSGFKRKPGAERWLFEEHHYMFSGKRFAEICGTRLHHAGEMKYGLHSIGTEVSSRHQITARKRCRSGRMYNLRTEWLAAQRFLFPFSILTLNFGARPIGFEFCERAESSARTT